jgi:translin
MSRLDNIATAIERELDEKDRMREFALKESREIIRLSKDIISAMNKMRSTKGLVKRMLGKTTNLKKRLERHSDLLRAGYVEAAQMEVTEVCVLLAMVNRRKVPTPMELNVTSEAYLLGLGDAIGELRRVAIDALREQRYELAKERLSDMEEIYDLLTRFDYPDAIVSIRRKRDVARNLIERTRGEILVSKGEKDLKDKMDKVISALGPREKGKRRKRRQKGHDRR